MRIKSDKRQFRQVAKLILGLFFLCSLAWSIFVPVFEAPDETTVYDYGRYYTRTWELPVLTQKPLPSGVHHWEPLYFMLLGRIAKIIDAPLSDGSRYHYPASWTRIREENPKNLYRHETKEFKFGWDKLAWSLHAMRLLSVFLATGSVWMVYKTGREVFPEPNWLPIAAMMLFAFNPQFVFFSGILNVVNMVTFTFSVFLWLLIRWMKTKMGKLKEVAILGAVFGIAIFSKMTALALLPVTLLAVAWKRFRLKKPVIVALMVFLMAFMVVGGWYLVRNQMLYGEFSGSRAHVLYRFGRITNPFLEEVGLLNFIISYPKTQWTTLWSGFGWITVYLPQVFPLIMLVLYLHGILGLMSERYKNKLKLNEIQKSQLTVLALMPVSVWLGITKVIFEVEVFHGKDLFLVTGALAIVVVVGLKSLIVKMKKRDWLSRKGKWLMTLLVGFLTVFWLRQMELAKLFKGIATFSEINRMFFVGVMGMIVMRLIWLLLSSQRSRKAFIKNVQFREAIWIKRLVILAVVANLIILFGLMVPAIYQRSVWQLLR